MYTLVAIVLFFGDSVTTILTKHKDQPSCLKAMEKVINLENNVRGLIIKTTCVEE